MQLKDWSAQQLRVPTIIGDFGAGISSAPKSGVG
jgi:hypothetical protein